jgi:DNA polymerase
MATREQLLDATIDHLEAIRARGIRWLVPRPSSEHAQASAQPDPAPDPVPATVAVALAAASAPPASSAPVYTPTIMPSASKVADRLADAPTPGTRPAALGREAKEAAMAALRSRALGCVLCPHLAAARTQVVFGVGDIHSPLMFVGEAPGADEDLQGEPFVGKAGQLLTRIIQTMGFTRQSVYIANVLKCRPDTPGQSAGNRKPTPEEMQTCLPYLREQIRIIAPRALVALGVTALQGLFGETFPITKIRGRWMSFQDIPVMPTYHPAYLLRNQALAEKRKVWEDMLQVLEKLEAPITEKQRGFFLRPAGE